jgi:Ribosome biogenesis protein Nop16
MKKPAYSMKGKTKLTAASKKVAKRQGRMRRSAVPEGPLRAAWDMRLTGVQNLARTGLAPTVNRLPARAEYRVASQTPPDETLVLRSRKKERGYGKNRNAEKALPERYDVRVELERVAALPEKVMKQVLRPGENNALGEMVAVYGDDYQAMARDIKRNYLQWTPAQLKCKCERRTRLLSAGNTNAN